MNQLFSIIALLCIFNLAVAQDLTYGLRVNDLSARVMKPLDKPGYLQTVTDPSFGTTIRRISNANQREVIKPMYSSVQAWNADESYMILYKQNNGHILLNGKTYKFIRNLNDIRPDDFENVFWDFNNPDIFYYLDKSTSEFIRYTVSSSNKKVIVDLNTKVTNCNGPFSMGEDIQMMSWDSDVFGFICSNSRAYSYRISTGKLVEFNIANVRKKAPMPAPSGNYFYHHKAVYNAQGNLHKSLNESDVKLWAEHASLGKLSNGKDGYFAVAFDPSRKGGCLGDVVAHDVETANCYTITSQEQGYEYTQSNTHISALSHKNTQKGWLAASMVGYDKDGQSLLDQELIIARANEGNIQVCRIGHHRSDPNEFGYWGEPHAVISPTGTRVLFASDWSGAEDGKSVDSYVVELPSYNQTVNPPTNPVNPPTTNEPNSIDWNPKPTKLTTGTNQIPLAFSIDQDGLVVVQMFNNTSNGWAKIGEKIVEVSKGDNQQISVAVTPYSTPNNTSYIQAMLVNRGWEDVNVDPLQVEINNNTNPTTPVNPPTTNEPNSIDWNPKPTKLTPGTNQIPLAFSIDQDGLVVVQMFNDTNNGWAKIGEKIVEVSKGDNQQISVAVTPYSTPNNTSYIQAMLVNRGWGNVNVDPLQVAVSYNSNGKLKNEGLNKVSILPNPFNNQTQINYQVEKSGTVSINIYSADGKQLKELVSNQYFKKGSHQLSIDGTQLSTGMYFIHLTSGDKVIIEKLYKY